MDITLSICVNDGTDILVDGFDEIAFSNDATTPNQKDSGYNWQRSYPDILNVLADNKFLIFTRHDVNHGLEYREHSFAFSNSISENNQPLILTTQSITTIINMYS